MKSCCSSKKKMTGACCCTGSRNLPADPQTPQPARPSVSDQLQLNLDSAPVIDTLRLLRVLQSSTSMHAPCVTGNSLLAQRCMFTI